MADTVRCRSRRVYGEGLAMRLQWHSCRQCQSSCSSGDHDWESTSSILILYINISGADWCASCILQCLRMYCLISIYQRVEFPATEKSTAGLTKFMHSSYSRQSVCEMKTQPTGVNICSEDKLQLKSITLSVLQENSTRVPLQPRFSLLKS
jgi:hypothetical protein